MDESNWQQRSAEILTGMKEWREAHPKATFVEIEAVVHQRVMALEAQMLQEAASTSESRLWGESSESSAPTCPACGVPLQARGKHKRRLLGNGGQDVTLERTSGICPSCGQGFFPSGS